MNVSIRTSPANAMGIEELIVAQSFLQLLTERIHENGFDVPSAYLEDLRQIDRELDEKLRADKMRRLQILEAKGETLKTADERRRENDSQIKALRQELGLEPQSKRKGA